MLGREKEHLLAALTNMQFQSLALSVLGGCQSENHTWLEQFQRWRWLEHRHLNPPCAGVGHVTASRPPGTRSWKRLKAAGSMQPQPQPQSPHSLLLPSTLFVLLL